VFCTQLKLGVNERREDDRADFAERPLSWAIHTASSDVLINNLPAGNFAHQNERIVVGVAKESHP
jgi:hypothetical protein